MSRITTALLLMRSETHESVTMRRMRQRRDARRCQTRYWPARCRCCRSGPRPAANAPPLSQGPATRAEDRLDWPWVFDERRRSPIMPTVQPVISLAISEAEEGHHRGDIFWLAGGGRTRCSLTNATLSADLPGSLETVAVIRVSAPGQIAGAHRTFAISRATVRVKPRIPALAAE